MKRAYMHEKCDLQTVQLYFREQLNSLWWGQHHFPESCGITEEEFENIVSVANKILSENCNQPYDIIAADTERDNWKTAQEACEYGLIDRVITDRAEQKED